MARAVSMKLIPALLLVAFSATASASGFQLLEQNASGIGNAYAGSAAVAENASTIYYNPAGMTQLEGVSVSGGGAAIRTSYKFSDQGTVLPGTGTGSGNGGDAGGWGFVPNAYASMALTKDWYAGIGISSPFGLKTEYASDWIGRYQSTSFDIKTININPSLAYRVNEKVSLGFGLNWQQINAEYVRQSATYGGSAKVSLDDSSWGWNAGALFTLSPSTKVGVSYRSAIKHETTGNTRGITSAENNAVIKLPDTFILSVSQKLSDKWDMLGDVSRTGWSSIPNVDIMTSSGALQQRLDTQYRNTWRVALGANYQYSPTVKLKFGVAYDQTPTQDPQHRLTSLPDNNRVWLSTGAQYKVGKSSAIDVGLAYLYLRDPSINNDQSALNRGIVNGTYSGNVWIMGAQYSASF